MFSTIVAVLAFVVTTFCFVVVTMHFCFDPKFRGAKINLKLFGFTFVVWFVSGVYLWG